MTKFALIPTFGMMLLAICPDLSLILAQGSDWNGSYFVSNYDEVAYSGYVNGLVNGRPRKSDPFLATGNSTPEAESFYSIQFIPAYAIALPSSVLGLSASSAFLLLMVVGSAVSALAVFSFLYCVTRTELLSAVGTLVILCFGTAVSLQGQLRLWLQASAVCDFFPFLRRYQPGLGFPLFFAFCLMVWRSLSKSERTGAIYAALGGVILAILVYSYFYLWTAAMAWLATLTVVSLPTRAWRNRTAINLPIIGIIAAGAMIPYVIMVTNRSSNLDRAQILNYTRWPDFSSVSLIIGLIIAALTFLAVFKGIAKATELQTLFVLSFSLTPLVIFNQQLLTGRSLQPIHYEIFISNYIVLTALVLGISMILSQTVRQTSLFRQALIYVGILAVGWGAIEASGSIRRGIGFAILRDQSLPAVAHVVRQEQTNQRSDRPRTVVVLATDFVTSDFIPSVSPFRTLWSPHTFSAGMIDLAENKRLFYLYLFYCGFDEKDLADALERNVFEVTGALFGFGRALPALGQFEKPILERETLAAVEDYSEFIKNFAKEDAFSPELSYLITESSKLNLDNLDHWYERDEGKILGRFTVYKLKPRS